MLTLGANHSVLSVEGALAATRESVVILIAGRIVAVRISGRCGELIGVGIDGVVWTRNIRGSQRLINRAITKPS